jgi:hypothetical protein
MNVAIKRCGLVAVSFVCSLGTAMAADPIVQDFDGWKITIQPGETAYSDFVPQMPRSATRSSLPLIRPASFQESLGEPRPEDAPAPAVTPAPAPAPAVTPAPVPSSTPTPLTQPPASVLPAPASAAPIPAPVIDGMPMITPGESSPCCNSTPIVSPPEGTVDPRYLSQMYYEVYKSIPFIRAEYNANPGYIHDTTVEFLFGRMRPTVVQRGSTSANYYSSYGFGSPYGYGLPYVFGGSGYVYPTVQIVPAWNRGWGPSYGRNN